MKSEIYGLHTLGRRYFVRKLGKIQDINIKIKNRFQLFLKNNEFDYAAAIREFENDSTTMVLMKSLSDERPYWYIEKYINEAILGNIEGVVPESHKHVSEMKAALKTACDEARISERSHFDISEEVKSEICRKEKTEFLNYLDSLTDSDYVDAPELFLRRVLSSEEVETIADRVEKLIKIEGSSVGESLCFKNEKFEIMVTAENLKEIIRPIVDENIYELNTGGIGAHSYVMELEGFEPYYKEGFNIYWCSDKVDWVITKDHEGYYFFYGEKLVREVMAKLKI